MLQCQTGSQCDTGVRAVIFVDMRGWDALVTSAARLISRGSLEHTSRVMFEQLVDFALGHTQPAQTGYEMAQDVAVTGASVTSQHHLQENILRD